MGQRNITEALIESGACYELKNSNGMTAVDLASNQMRDVFPNIKLSMAEDNNPLYRNRNQHHKAMVEKMLNTGPNANVNTSLVIAPKPSEKF